MFSRKLQKIYRGGRSNSSQFTLFCWEMYVFLVFGFIQPYSGLKLCSPFKTTQWGKVYFWVFVTAWIQKSPCLRWTTCTLKVDLLVMVIHTWTVCYVTLKCFVYMQFCMMLPVLCIQRRGKDRLIATWLDVDQTRVCLVISQDFFLSLFEMFCTFHIQPVQLLTKIAWLKIVILFVRKYF